MAVVNPVPDPIDQVIDQLLADPEYVAELAALEQAIERGERIEGVSQAELRRRVERQTREPDDRPV